MLDWYQYKLIVLSAYTDGQKAKYICVFNVFPNCVEKSQIEAMTPSSSEHKKYPDCSLKHLVSKKKNQGWNKYNTR